MRGLPLTLAGLVALLLIAVGPPATVPAPVPSFVDITWMSITNMYYELGPLRIVTDGYITRLPRERVLGRRRRPGEGARRRVPTSPR